MTKFISICIFILSTTSLKAQSLLPGATLLFKDVKTKLSIEDKNDIFLQTIYYFDVATKKLLPAKGASVKYFKEFLYEAFPTDMNHDGNEEIFLFSRLNNQTSYSLYIKKNNKYYNAGFFGQPGTNQLGIFNETNYGYNNIAITQYSNLKIYKFDGDKYVEDNYYKSIKQDDQPTDIFDFSLNYTHPLKTVTNPNIVSAYIFRNVKTRLSNEEKRNFAGGFAIQYRAGRDTSLVLVDENKIIGIDEGGRVEVDVIPTDLNHDGIDEIWMRTNGISFGVWVPHLFMYIKDGNGDYIMQDSVNSTSLLARATTNKGYPDLIASQPEGPAGMMQNLPTRFDVYRWNGTKYYVYKHNQPYLKTDKHIEGEIGEAYQKALPDSLLKNHILFDEPGTHKVTQTQYKITSNKPAEAAHQSYPPLNEPTLTPAASMLFSNTKTKLIDKDKEDIATLSNLTIEELNAKTKKGKSKIDVKVYPTDFDNDGIEEIFICITSAPLGINMNTYYFYGKDYYGQYKPMPGKIGQGVKVLLNGKQGFPDLITGTPGFNRQIWSWNGMIYAFKQNIAGNVAIPYNTMEINIACKEYLDNSTSENNGGHFYLFDGNWHSPDYNYSFKIKGKTGIATLSNSPNYRVGDVMLRIQNPEGDVYHGQQIYTDGAWHDVILKKVSGNLMWMKGGVEWYMKMEK